MSKKSHKTLANIARLTGDMVHHNGGTAFRNFTGIADPEADIMRLLDQVLAADDVPLTDVEALNAWLGRLGADDFNTVADGEESDVAAILSVAPSINAEPAADFINRIYEVCI